MEKSVQLLFVTLDPLPTNRPDVDVLFASELAKRGFRIDWVAPSAAGAADGESMSYGGGIAWRAKSGEGFSLGARARRLYSAFRNDLSAFGRIRRGNYDLVQVKDKFLGALPAVVAAKIKGVTLTYWLSFPIPEASFEQAKHARWWLAPVYKLRGVFFRWLLYRIILRLSDHVFAQSDQMKQSLIEEGIPGNKITAVPMGVRREFLKLCADRKRRTLPAGLPSIVYVGAMDPLRRLDVLLQSFAILCRSGRQARLHMIGDSDDPHDRQFLESEAIRLGVADRVVFTGQVDTQRAMNYIIESRVGVSPIPTGPVYDVSSPTKTIEYMAMRKPVVASEIPDSKAILTQSGGGICVPFDSSALADALAWMLDHPQEAQVMGDCGYDYVAKHRAYDVIADRVEATYRSILRDPGAEGSALASPRQ